jgi:secreted trypsin-like serine protease
MRRTWTGLAFVALGAANAAAGEFRMDRIGNGRGVTPKIIGGVRADRNVWPATLVFTDDGGGPCTATAIGDQVLITAAHCVVQSPSGLVVWNNVNVRLQCTIHPDYNDAPREGNGLACHLRVHANEIAACTADVALCQTTGGAVLASSVARFERIKAAPPAVAQNAKMALLGYGCSSAKSKPSGDLSVGSATVQHLSVPGASADPNKSFDEFIQTAGAGVCYGDSGGAGFTNTDPKKREIVGVVSRGNLSSGSSLVNLKDPRIAKFLTDFSSTKGISICGLDPAAKNCTF